MKEQFRVTRFDIDIKNKKLEYNFNTSNCLLQVILRWQTAKGEQEIKKDIEKLLNRFNCKDIVDLLGVKVTDTKFKIGNNKNTAKITAYKRNSNSITLEYRNKELHYTTRVQTSNSLLNDYETALLKKYNINTVKELIDKIAK